MLMNYHIGRLDLSSLCVGAFVAAGVWWCSFCRLKLLQPAILDILDIYKKRTTLKFNRELTAVLKKVLNS